MKRTVVELHCFALATALVLGACSTGRPYQPQDGGPDSESSGSGGGAGKGATGAAGGAGGHAGGGAGGHGGTGGAAGTGGATDGGASDAAKGPGLGHSCSSGTDCGSGFCVQGVCCSSACTDSCYACTNALTGSSPDGTCAVVSQGLADPAGGCSPGTLTSCGNTGHCDGKGACEKLGSSTVCLAASCGGGGFTSSSTCDGKGTCTPGTMTDCKGFSCSATTGCATKCTADADCPGGYCTSTMTCAATTSDGSTCSKNSQCTHANCISGICCAAACTGTCMTCATGQCKPVASGGSSAGACAADSTACGHDGTCDGNGGCRYATTSVSCGAVSCSGGQLTPTGLCNGAGTCSTPAAAACSGGVVCASTTACKPSTCTADADCGSGLCQSGACAGKRSNGQACTATDQCTSGFCANGVCCGSACTGTCQACTNALTGSSPNGTCAAVSQGLADPAGGCAAGTAASCGNTGHCDGKGACEKLGSSTVCLAASCGSSGYTSASTCNGMGTCTPGTTTGCKGFSCSATTGCATSCSADTDCPGGYCTSAMTCAATMSDGSTCSKNSQCAHANCISGICCATTCTGTCMTCTTGQCKPVASGGSSAGACMVDSTTCGHDGTCDGNGGCRYAVTSVSCGTPACSNAQLTPMGNCSGSGTCATGASGPCANNLVCASTTACKTTCSADTDCVSTAYCSNGSCLPKKSNGSTCGAPNQCSSTICAPDGICCNRACINSCEACDNAGSVGTCSPVQSGPVHGNRSPCFGGGTACAGSCMGLTSGLCSYPTYGCGTASCSGTQFVSTGTCNGNGSCASPAAQNCSGGYACSANACKTSCTADGDCVSGDFCEAGTCHLAAKAIAAGEDHTCVLLSDGSIRCWGDNSSGELGNGTMTTTGFDGIATPVAVMQLTAPATTLATGNGFSCAVLSNGSIWCWGGDTQGALGTGTLIAATGMPVKVALSGSATAIAAGFGHACAIVGGAAWCWGYDVWGQLGNGQVPGNRAVNSFPMPGQVSGLTSVSVISCGGTSTCADSAGGISCWGDDYDGELGNNLVGDSNGGLEGYGTPQPFSGTDPNAIIALAEGQNHSCLLDSTGMIECWGLNDSGQLGNGNNLGQTGSNGIATPVIATGQLSFPTAIAANIEQTCALNFGGSVACWGHNGEGELGNGNTTDQYTAVLVVDLPSPAIAIAVGGFHTCAIVKNGSAWCWGQNSSGQLGDGLVAQSLTPVQVSGW